MAKGYYNVIHNPEKTDIIFETHVEPGIDIPEDQQNLVIDIGNTLATINLLFNVETENFKKAFKQLFLIAKTGLEGDIAQPSLALKALTQFKKETVDRESGKIKNNYLRKLGTDALILGLPILIFGSILNWCSCAGYPLQCVRTNYVANMMVLWSGTMLGVWLSFAITRANINFEDLAIIEKDRLEPMLRLIFTGSIAIIFGFLFITRSLEIKLGELSSNNFISDPIIAMLIGAILGMNEKILGNALTKKTSNVFQA